MNRPSTPTADRGSVGTRIGRFLARHRSWVMGLWAMVLLVAAVGASVFNDSLGAPNFLVEGSDSARAQQLIDKHLGDVGEQDALVFHSDRHTIDDAEFVATLDNVLRKARAKSWVTNLLDPRDLGGAAQVSEDRHTAYAVVGIAGDATQRSTRANELQSLVRAATRTGEVDVDLTGFTPLNNDLIVVENRGVERAELIGIPIALLLLLFALGSVVSAVLPVGVASLGVLTTFGVLGACTAFMGFDPLAPAIVTMVGLGVGIDYSMFLVSRFREELATDQDVEAAVGRAMATAGHTVLASGVVVVVSLASLGLVRSPLFHELALAASLSVVGAMLVSLTLLPAALAAIGERLGWGSLPARFQPPEVAGRPAEAGFWAGWAHTIMRRPVLSAAAVTIVLLAAAAPLFGMRFGIDLGLNAVAEHPSGRGLTLLTEKFDPGLVSPIEVVVVDDHGPLDARDLAAVERLTAAVEEDDAVGSVVSVASLGEFIGQPGRAPTPEQLTALRAAPATGASLAPILSSDGRATVVIAAPSVPIDSSAANELVDRIRHGLAPAAVDGTGLTVAVTGSNALTVDMSREVNGQLPEVIGLVLALSFAYLVVAFRSLLLAAKAIIMNLLATGAAFGLLVVVFQHGVGEAQLGFTSPGYIQVYLPVVMFALLFGLSMDYEVFLVHRIRESWMRSGDNTHAVAEGIEHTARPISAAAAIMVAVFGAFVVTPVLELKQFGFGLAVAIALDATLVRLVLVPALMDLAGRWNWWLPSWVDTALSRLVPGSRTHGARSGAAVTRSEPDPTTNSHSRADGVDRSR